MDWMKGAMLDNSTVSGEDFDYLTLTDDIEEVVDIMVKHRAWKESMIKKE